MTLSRRLPTVSCGLSLSRQEQTSTGTAACLGDTTTTSPILQVKPPKTQEARDRHTKDIIKQKLMQLGPSWDLTFSRTGVP